MNVIVKEFKEQYMVYYKYHTEQDSILEQLDAEFNIVTVVGFPEDGHSPGYDLAIFDSRSEEEIRELIRKIEKQPGRTA